LGNVAVACVSAAESTSPSAALCGWPSAFASGTLFHLECLADTSGLINVSAADGDRRDFTNSGAVSAFEDALRSAAGDILFLSDDDDLWATTKVKSFLSVFESQPNVGLVTSRVRLIDEDGWPLPNSRINRGGRFSPGFWQNALRNHYQGSAMAIRASLLGRVLPFPKAKSFLHDAWIGTRYEIGGGKTVFIDEDLLFYRRHPQSLSRAKTRWNQVRTRIDLLLSHISHALRPTTR